MNYYYFALLAACCAYAFAAGGGPERWGATILAVGSVLTVAVIAPLPLRFRSVEVEVVVIDILCFAVYTVLALRADRFWPIWVSALVGVGALGHLGKWYGGPEIGRWPYAFAIAVWSYPMIALIAIGTLNHQRRAAARARGDRERGRVER